MLPRNLFDIFLVLFLSISCGPSSSEENAASGSALEDTTPVGPPKIVDKISSVINTSYGGASMLKGWHLLLFNQRDGYGHLTPVKENGLIEFQKVDINSDYTLVLLTSELQLASILVINKPNDQSLYTSFTGFETTLPYLVYNGPTMTFGQAAEIRIKNQTATDENKNNVPDGVDSQWQLVDSSKTNPLTKAESPPQTEVTGAPIAATAGVRPKEDLDSDGIINRLDRDDDGDTLPDVLDADSNGTNVVDLLETTHDQFFNNTVEFSTIGIEYVPETKEGAVQYLSLIWLVRVNPQADIVRIQVTVPPSIKSAALLTDAEGNDVAWNGEIFDDGLHEDLNAQDKVYAVKVKIPAANPPLRYQSYFISITERIEEQEVTRDYPGSFPDIPVGKINLVVSGGLVKITGSPLGEGVQFNWSALILDREDNLLFITPSQTSQEMTYSLPVASLPARADLKLKVIVSSPQRISGYPTYRIHSKVVALDLSPL